MKHPSVRRRSRAALAGLVASATALSGVLVAAPPASARTGLFSQGFRNDTAPGDIWQSPPQKGAHNPCLTAAPKSAADSLPACNAVTSGHGKPDALGEGAFQITDNTHNDAGALVLNKPIASGAGLHISFDTFQYNAVQSNGRGGDGMSFFLIDGAQNVKAVGETGGALGYKGLPGGIVGIGLDTYGNFSNPDCCGKGGPGAKPNSVVVRGSEATGYQYVSGVTAPAPLGVDSAKTRDAARRTVNVDVSTANRLNLYVDFYDGKGKQKLISDLDLNKIPGQDALPATLKMGFAASTGAATAYHEIRDFSVSSLDPDLAITMSPQGEFTPGGAGDFKIDVTNKASAGPTTGDVTTTFDVPEGLTPKSASGDGWNCTVAGQKVTCTRPGGGTAALRPGQAAPPITVSSGVAANASTGLKAQAGVATPNEHNPKDNTTAPVDVPIKALAPNVKVDVKPDGPLQAGGTGTITAVASNATDAGPTTGPVTVTVPAPPGTTVKAASGDGWKCDVADAKATCTRPGPLKPGEAAPPLKVTVNVPATVTGPVPVTGTVATTGDSDPKDNTAKPVDATVTPAPKGPDVSATITADGPIKAGSPASLTGTVSNAKDAGPTTGPVTLTIPAPKGTTIKGATGDGWKCDVTAEKATCTRPGPLKPGETTPPVKVDLNVPADANGGLQVTATADTKGDTDPSNNTSKPTEVPLEAKAPDLSTTVKADGPLKAGEPGALTGTVSNAKDAGPTTGPITLTIPAPKGTTIKGATGDGWKCDVAAEKATCTRPGPLKPGETAPPVKVDLNVPTSATGDTQVTGTVATPGDSGPDNNTSKPATVPITAKAPDISPTIKADGPIKAGEPASLTGTVANAKDAGPTTGPITLTIPAPKGTTIKGATGDGWKCDVAGAKATCTRPDVLNGGDTTPPVKVTLDVPADASGTTTVGAAADTKGDSDPANNTSKPADVPIAAGPNLKTTVAHDGTPTAGKPTTYTVTVSNAKDAGPTTAPVTSTFTVPDGQKITSATGGGWQCTVAGQKVTCTRPDVLQPGTAYPPVKVVVEMPAGSGGTDTTPTATTDTKGEADPKDNSAAPDKATIAHNADLKLTVSTSPNPYKTGEPLTYTATVTNNGPDAVKGAHLKVNVPDIWSRVPWRCTATDGATCPTAKGVGDIDVTIDVPKGGKVEFTASCILPKGFAAPLKSDATLTLPAGTASPSCDPKKGCTATDANPSTSGRMMYTF